MLGSLLFHLSLCVSFINDPLFRRPRCCRRLTAKRLRRSGRICSLRVKSWRQRSRELLSWRRCSPRRSTSSLSRRSSSKMSNVKQSEYEISEIILNLIFICQSRHHNDLSVGFLFPLIFFLSFQGRTAGLRQQVSGSEENHSAAADWTPATLQQSGDGSSCQHCRGFTTRGQSWLTRLCWIQVRFEVLVCLFFNTFILFVWIVCKILC